MTRRKGALFRRNTATISSLLLVLLGLMHSPYSGADIPVKLEPATESSIAEKNCENDASGAPAARSFVFDPADVPADASDRQIKNALALYKQMIAIFIRNVVFPHFTGIPPPVS